MAVRRRPSRKGAAQRSIVAVRQPARQPSETRRAIDALRHKYCIGHECIKPVGQLVGCQCLQKALRNLIPRY